MLGIHPKTLHHWLKEADVPFALHPSDARIKCVEQQHLREVAQLHDRLLPELPTSSEEQARSLPTEPEQSSSSLSPIEASEPDLMQKLSCLETKVMTLQEQLAQLALTLLAEREHTLERRLTTLETMTAELLGRPVLPPSLPQGQITVPTPSSAAVPYVARSLNPAELRARARLIPLIEFGADGTYVVICPQEGELSLTPDSPAWFEWFATLSSFRFVGQSGRFTAYRESKRRGPTRSWSAVRSLHNHNYKHHLGVTDHLTIARLEQMAAKLQAYMTSL